MKIKYNPSNHTQILIYIILLLPFTSVGLYKIMTEYYVYIISGCMALMILSLGSLSLHCNKMAATVCVAVCGIFVLHANNSGFGMIMQIIWPLVLVYVYRQTEINVKFIKRLYYVSIVFYVLTAKIILSYGDISKFINSQSQNAMNPNTAGNLIACFTIFIVFCRNYVYPNGRKWFTLFFYLVSVFLLYKCEARMALLALAACLLFEIFGEVLKDKKKFLIVLIFAIFAAGVFVPVIYVKMWKAKTFNNTLILGKNFYTGRQYIWISFFSYIMKHLPESVFIGSGYNESFYVLGTFNLHNTYLAIFACFGSFIFFAYLVYFTKVIDRAEKLNDDKCLNLRQYRLLLMLFFYLFIGLTETSLNFLQMLFPLGMSIGLMLNPRLASREKADVIFLKTNYTEIFGQEQSKP